MGEVINFPTPATRDWKETAELIIESMRAAQLSDVAQKHILERMETFHSKLYRVEFDFTFPAGTPEVIGTQVDKFAEKLHTLSAELFLDRLLVEVELSTALNL